MHLSLALARFLTWACCLKHLFLINCPSYLIILSRAGVEIPLFSTNCPSGGHQKHPSSSLTQSLDIQFDEANVPISSPIPS